MVEITRLYSCILLSAEREMEAITLMTGRDEGIFQTFPKNSCLIQGQERKSERAGLCCLFPKFELRIFQVARSPH